MMNAHASLTMLYLYYLGQRFLFVAVEREHGQFEPEIAQNRRGSGLSHAVEPIVSILRRKPVVGVGG